MTEQRDNFWSDRSNECDESDKFDRIRGDLDALAEAIDRRTYPGSAWPVRRRRRFRRPVVAAVAAAAAVIVAVLLARPGTVPLPNGGTLAMNPTSRQATSVPAAQPMWTVPSGITPAITAPASFTIPQIMIPSGNEADGFRWRVPTVSFPSSSEGSKSRDS